MGDTGSAYALLAALSGVRPSAEILLALTRRLAEQTQSMVEVWRYQARELYLELSWPPQNPDGPDQESVTAEAVAGFALVQEEGHTHGAVTVTVDPARVLSEREDRDLVDTANCVLLLWRQDELSTATDQQSRLTARLAGELAESGRRLSTARDQERRRIAVEILTLSATRFAQLKEHVRQIDAAVAAEVTPDPAAVRRLGAELDDLIESFRTLVRGIHSAVLQDRGPRAALGEVVAGLTRPARITGTVPDTVEPELASALYHLAATAVLTLTGRAAFEPVNLDPLEIHLTHVERHLRVLIRGRSSLSAASLRAALTGDTDRSAALGGGIQIRSEDGLIEVQAWWPDRLQPTAPALSAGPYDVLRRVRELTIALAVRADEGPESMRAWDLVRRLDAPLHLGVRGLHDRQAWLLSLGRHLPGVELVTDLGADDPDTHTDDWPDAILQASHDRPEESADLLLPAGGLLLRSAAWADLPELLTTELVARTQVLRIRSVLLRARSVLADQILRGPTPPGPAVQQMQYELEQLFSEAHEVAELEALAYIRTGELNLTETQIQDAERLLGSVGPSAAERLALPVSTGQAALLQAAGDQLKQWRRLGSVAAGGPRYRQVCGVIIRTGEGLLSELAATPDSAAGSAR